MFAGSGHDSGKNATDSEAGDKESNPEKQYVEYRSH